MHFGRVEQLAGIDLTLPPDTERTERFLRLPRSQETRVYFGCPIWATKKWVPYVYPQELKANQYLAHYATKYNAVEVNSTFYHILDKERIGAWRDDVPPAFRFCPKVYRGITEGLAAAQLPDLINQYAEGISAFKDRLGLVFAQFPETCAPRHGQWVKRFLDLWPTELPLAVEFRHRDWFHDHSLSDDVINTLYRKGIATVITDTPGRRDVLHTSLTQPRVMIRFQGNELHPTDSERLAQWADRVKKWTAHSLEEIYLFTHQPSDERIPETADAFAQHLHS